MNYVSTNTFLTRKWGVLLFASLSFVSMISTLFSSIGIQHYTTSYTRFAPEFRHLSALHGVSTYQRLIRGLYFFKPLEQETATNRLCKQLFHSMDNRRHFHVVTIPSLPAHHFSPRLIAQLVKLLHESNIISEPDHEKKDAGKNDAGKKIAEAIKKIITEDPAFKASRDKESKSTQKNIATRINKFSHDLVAACQESGWFSHSGIEPIYSTHTPFRILQAFLFEKFSNKESLDAYHQELSAYFKVNQTTHVTTPATPPVTPDGARYDERDAEQYEMNIIASQLTADLPALDQYRDTCYTFTTAQGAEVSVQFSDCMDNTLRHLFHIVAYNPATKSFDPTRLTQLAAPGKQVSQALLQYLQMFTTAEEANRRSLPSEPGRKDGHDAWASLISNIPGIGYVRVYEGAHGSCLHKSLFPQEFAEQAVTLEGREYRLIDGQDLHLYEAEVSLRNVIVAFNELLGLGLFDLTDKDFIVKKTGNGFCSPTFVDHYWPQLLTHLGWSCPATDLHAQKMRMTIHQTSDDISSQFMLYLCQGVHADITPSHLQQGRAENFIINEALICSFFDRLLYRLLIECSTKRLLWDFAKNSFLIADKSNISKIIASQRITDACCAYYQELLLNDPGLEDIVNPCLYSFCYTFPQGIGLLKQLKELNQDLFLEAILGRNCINGESGFIDQKNVEVIYGSQETFFKALTAINNESIAKPMLKVSEGGLCSFGKAIVQAYFDNQRYDDSEKLFTLITQNYITESGTRKDNPRRLPILEVLSLKRSEQVSAWLKEKLTCDQQFFNRFSTIVSTICKAIKENYSERLYHDRDDYIDCNRSSDDSALRALEHWIPQSWLEYFFQDERIGLLEIDNFCRLEFGSYALDLVLFEKIISLATHQVNDVTNDFKKHLEREVERKLKCPEYIVICDIARMIAIILHYFPAHHDDWLETILGHDALVGKLLEKILHEVNDRIIKSKRYKLFKRLRKLILQEKWEDLEKNFPATVLLFAKPKNAIDRLFKMMIENND